MRSSFFFIGWFAFLIGQAQSVIITKVEAIPRPRNEPEPFTYRSGDSLVQLSYRQNNAMVYFRTSGSDPVFSFHIPKVYTKAIVTRDSAVFLPNLPNGEFTLLINDLRHPSIKPARLNFIVESPVWLRWWFLPVMFGYGLLFVSACLYLLYRYRLRQFLRMQQTRDRIARDLHDDMGSYLSSISILSAAMPADPVRAQQNLDRIGQTARQVMDNMSDIVWSINPAQDTMQQVLDRMKQVADDLFGTTDTAIQFEVGPGVESLSLPLERRRDFFLAYKEALTNVARYAEATSVQIHLQHTNNQLHLQLLDNGVGFDPATPVARPGGGNGLRNLAHRADSLSGTFTIESAPGQGTQVDLRLPI